MTMVYNHRRTSSRGAPTGTRTLDPRINLLHEVSPATVLPACSLDYIFTFGLTGQVRRV